MKPKVLHAITRLNIGGPGRHVLDVAGGLADRFDISIVAGTPPTHEGELDPGAVAVQPVPMVRSVSPWVDVRALVSMRRSLRSRRPALVHSHMAKAGAVARIAAATTPERPAVVHTFHGHVLSGYFHHRTELAFAQVERRLARHTDVFIAVSSEIRDELLALGIGEPHQYEVVPLGIDLDPLLRVSGRSGTLRAHLGLDPDVPLIVVPARLAPVKDHSTLLAALVDLPHVHVALLGDGELRSDLAREVTDRNLTGRVHFVGWWDDMPAALADADVVTLTSRNEGTPLALIEAAAAGRPVVATAVGGVPDVVSHGETGLLVSPADHRALSRALSSLLEDGQYARRLGSTARRVAVQRFGMAPSLDRLAHIYDDLLAGRTAVRRSRP